LNKLREKKIISFLFNTIIFLTLLLPTEGSLSQAVDSNDKTVFFVEDNFLENGQHHPVEAEPAPSISPQPKESPIILEKSEDNSSKEGIGDAFAKDHGDKFQHKNEEQISTNS
jgi:hypothetical protein